ncbi:ABC-2 family transporter protein [Pirellulimonas nuda]|uniref:ABC-2 family transporter protein n=1 Tax=Pirellulimonas nuda TaxID=2528009 RepID=A0A518DJL5_9BACT|nr:hypothetical protein [Pirellulimonas nuda]QDU91636.1 ABC-2 family transporter protein [Pirellulimonas nuda]
MNTPWAALVWKEWRETRWKMAALALLMAGFVLLTAITVKSRPFDGLLALGTLIVGACGIFVALGVAGGENARGTQQFLASLPVQSWRAAVAKLAMGAFAILTPAVALVVCVAAAQALATAFDPGNASRFALSQERPAQLLSKVPEALLMLSCVGLSFYLWTAAFAVNSNDEVRAGIKGVGGLVLWMLFCITVSNAAENTPLQFLSLTIVSLGPLGFLTSVIWDPYVWWPFLLSAVGHVLAAVWFVRRWGVESSLGSARQPQIPTVVTYWLSPPRRSITRALGWKALRESGPVVAAGLIGALGLGTLMSVIAYASHESFSRRGITTSYDWIEESVESLTFSFAFFGFLIAIVCGVGTVWGDVQPGINTFWRSRPCPPSPWFWSKCVVSLALIGVAFSLPSLLPVYGIWYSGNGVQMVINAALGALVGYATAVLMTTVLRSAVYACIVALAAAIATVSIVGNRSEWLPSAEARAALFVGMAGMMLLVAWQAFRKDWSVRG